MSIPNEPEFPPEQPLPATRPLPNLLTQGFLLAWRNWPFVFWAYAINLCFGLLAGVPFTTGLIPYLDHSVAAQKIAGTIDLTYLGELALHLRDTTFFPVAVHTAGWLSLLQLLMLFVLFAGTVFVYVSAEPPRFSVLLRGGIAYFWRFVRAGILVGCVAALILGILFALRAALLERASQLYLDRKLFYFAAASGAVILLVALLLRIWFDLVEVYVVRNAMDGERRAHQALLPALLLMYRNFFRISGSFLLIGAAGLSALGLCFYVWKRFVPAHQVWLAGLLAQLGLFVLLASRFWQRGIEVALVMSIDPPIVAAEEIAALVEDEELPELAGVAGVARPSDPTLRDLVQKLRSEPWANPEAARQVQPPAPASVEAEPAAPALPTALTPGEKKEPVASLLDRHATKFPLGGQPPDEEVSLTSPTGPPDPTDPPNPPNLEQWPPRKGRPLP